MRSPSSRKLLTKQPCAVCSKPTTEFNYKVISCNKCKMVFRRAVKSGSSVTPCACLVTGSQCRICIFYACIESGMQISSVLNSSKLPSMIKQLDGLNDKRIETFFNFQMSEDLGLDEVMSLGFVKKRDENVIFTAHDWVLMEIYASIQFMKGFNLANLLCSDDLKLFIKNAYFKSAIYFIAFRSYLGKLDYMTFPCGKDVFPEEIPLVRECFPELLNKIRCILISKFIEFRVTKEELLLVISIIFCDPGAKGLSKDAINVISQYQKIYSSALFQFCLQNGDEHSAPGRFTNLLFLSQVLTKTIEDLDRAVTLFRLYQPNVPLTKLVNESF